MVQAIIFDFFGVIRPGGGQNDQQLLDFIASLRPHYKTGLLSNLARGGLADLLTSHQIQQCFDVAVASGDIGFAKPQPEAYQAVAERLGVSVQACVMVDDEAYRCEGARVAGMQAIHYQNFVQFRRGLEELLGQERANAES